MSNMKVICIKHPWAWLIFHGKNIENRTWKTRHRGLLHIAASARQPPKAEMEAALDYARQRGVTVPIHSLRYGGIIGSVHVVECVEHHDSPWFMGPIGWVLKDQKELPFLAIKGQLGIFDMFKPPEDSRLQSDP